MILLRIVVVWVLLSIYVATARYVRQPIGVAFGVAIILFAAFG